MKVPLLNFVGSPGTPPLNFEGGPGVPLLNFRGGPGSRIPGSWGPGDVDYQVGHFLYDIIMYQNCLLRHQNLSSGPPGIANCHIVHQITNHRPQKFKK